MLSNKWEYTTMAGGDCIINGIYKVVKYGQGWFAYYKPKGWKCWGNSCEHKGNGESVSYKTMKEAKEACNTHSQRIKEE